MDYLDWLRRLAINDESLADDEVASGLAALDPRTLALCRLAALVAIGGAEPSFGAYADDAISAGATPDELVAVLVGVVPIVGMPRAVAAAPDLALALGHDLEDSGL